MKVYFDDGSEIVLGIFYQMPDGSIAYTCGWTGPDSEVRYYLDDGEGTRLVHVDEFRSWEPRPDLEDFPNARDPRVPYEFDLYWDVKTISGLRRLLDDVDDTEFREAVLATMEKHGIVLPPVVSDEAGANPGACP